MNAHTTSRSNNSTRLIFVFAFILLFGADAFAASKSWTNGGDGVSWSDKNNWSGGLVPDSTSDVTIGVVAGNPTIVVNVVAQAHSVSSQQPMSITGGGSLTLGATSSIPALTINTGTLSAAGTGTTFAVSVPGATTFTGANLYATGGGQLLFTLAAGYTYTGILATTTISASGAGSKIDLSHMTSFKGGASNGNAYATHVLPTNGGEIDLAGVIDVNFQAPRNDITLDGTGGILGVAGITAMNNTILTVAGTRTLSFSALTAMTGTDLKVTGGSQLLFTLAAGYTYSGILATTTISASGAGSKIDLSHMTSFKGGASNGNAYATHVLPTNGGEIDLAGVIDVNFQAPRNDITLSGAGSILNVTAVTTVANTNFKASGAGAIMDLSPLPVAGITGPSVSMTSLNGALIGMGNILTGAAGLTLNATFGSATDVPFTFNGGLGTGKNINFTLNYTPTAGTTLMVLQNSSATAITKFFANLAQLQIVPLTFSSTTYNFISNYNGGGAGRDLVLHLPGNNSLLAGLVPSAGVLNPVFASGTTSYTDAVTNAPSSMTVTPTAADINATIQVQVNGGAYATVTSGSPSGPLNLNVGANTINVQVTSEDGSSTLIYTVQVTFTVAPEIAIEFPVGSNIVDGATNNLGSIDVGSSSGVFTYTVKNLGSANLTGLVLTKDGANNADLTLTAPLVTTLTPGTSTTFTVTFKPGAAGPRTAAIHLASNDADENPFDINFTGTGTSPEIVVERPVGFNVADGSTNTLGSVPVGSTSGVFTYTVKNTGNANLTGLVLTKDGTNSADILTTAPLVTTLAPGASTTFTLTFKPGAAGPRTAAIHLANNDFDENPFDINLTGTGNGPEIDLTRDSGIAVADGVTVDLGSLPVGTLSGVFTYTVKNLGNANLTGLVLTKNGVNNADLTLTAPLVTTLAPGASTTFTLIFKPGAAGPRAAAIHLANNDFNENPYDVNFTFTGNGPEIVVEKPVGFNVADGSTNTLGSVPVGSTSGVFTYTVKNTGNANLTGLVLTKDGTNSADILTTAPVLTTLTPGASTTFTVKFKPLAAGSRTAAIHLANNDFDENPFDISLTGTGTGTGTPEIDLTRGLGIAVADGATNDLGSLPVGTLSGAYTSYVVKNLGNANLTGLVLTKDGANNADLTLTAPPVTTLAPGETTTFTVSWVPGAVGLRTAAIHLASNDSDENPYDVNLTFTGLNPIPILAAIATLPTWDELSASNSASSLLSVPVKPVVSVVVLGGYKYLSLTVTKVAGQHPRRIIEVSPNLLDWFSGPLYTTVMQNDADFLKVRDNTPITPDHKRYIRLK